MAAFPPDWQIYDNDQFSSFTIPATADAGLGAALCIQIRPDGRATEHFKVVLFGGEFIQAAFPATILFNLPEAAGASFFFQCAPVDAAPRVDMTSTGWQDVEDMMRQRTLLVLDAKGDIVEAGSLHSRMTSNCAKKAAVGASIRWAVAVADGGKLELQLQGLPLPAKFLNSEVPYRKDNVHVIILASIPLNADLFDGVYHAGPVPLLFSSHKEETLASLLANPGLAHAGKTVEYDTRASSFLIAVKLSYHTPTVTSKSCS